MDADRPATDVLSESELLVLRHVAEKKLRKNPTLEEAMAAIARYGGHLRSNGRPGWLTLSRGYFRLQDLAIGFDAAIGHTHSQPASLYRLGEIDIIGEHFALGAHHPRQLHLAHAQRVATAFPAPPAQNEAGQLPQGGVLQRFTEPVASLERNTPRG